MPPSPESGRESGFEPRDASSKWIFGLVIMLLVGVVMTQLVLRGVKASFEKKPAPSDSWAGSWPGPNPGWTQANAPRLQVSPAQDLAAFRAQENAVLGSYGWIDSTNGVVRIPVQRAMDLLLEHGLPVRAGINQSRLGPTPYELQLQRTNAIRPETSVLR